MRKRKRRRKRNFLKKDKVKRAKLPTHSILPPTKHVNHTLVQYEPLKKVNDMVDIGDDICLMKFQSVNEFVIIHSPYEGVVKEVNYELLQKFSGESCIMKIEGCSHPEIIFGMCTICNSSNVNRKVSAEKDSKFSNLINFVHGDQNLKIDKSEAIKIDAEYQKELIREKKLVLVLDLDHTLIHCTHSQFVKHWINNKKEEELKKIGIRKFVLCNAEHFVKLRRDLSGFLRNISRMYQLHIWTHGTKTYAQQIQMIIDPHKKIFGNRVVSRDECPDIGSKTLRNQFPSNIDKVMIIDDRGDVWKEHLERLLKIQPYVFFSGMKDVNNAPGGKKGNGGLKQIEIEDFVVRMENNLKRDEKDNQLKIFFRVLENIYNSFYEKKDQVKEIDVSDILKEEKRKVLMGTNIVFSRLFPLNRDPTKEVFWTMAVEYGAKCHVEFGKSITHLVVSSKLKVPTEKINSARRRGDIFIVTEKWLLNSVKNWKRENEYNYLSCTKIFSLMEKPLTENFPKFKVELENFQENAQEIMDDIQRSKGKLSDLRKEIDELLEVPEDVVRESEKDDFFNGEEEDLEELTVMLENDLDEEIFKKM